MGERPVLRQLRIAVEGNIGSGKSTFLSCLQTYEDIFIVPEPVDQWKNLSGHNLLNNSFFDPKRHSFTFQSFVQLTRLKCWTEETNAAVKIIERSLQSNRFVYLNVARTMGNISTEEFTVLTEQFDTLAKLFDVNLDLIIYLRTDPLISYRRMVARGRMEESPAKIKYLQELHQAYDQWLWCPEENPMNCPIVTVDANKSQKEVFNEIFPTDDILGQFQKIISGQNC